MRVTGKLTDARIWLTNRDRYLAESEPVPVLLKPLKLELKHAHKDVVGGVGADGDAEPSEYEHTGEE